MPNTLHDVITEWPLNVIFFLFQLLGFLCSIGTFLCSFNCGPPPPSYDKMLESSTHFTLHETVTPRAVTTETIPPSSGPAPAQSAHRPTAPPALRHSKSSGGCPTVPPNPRHHQVHFFQNVQNIVSQLFVSQLR